MEFGAVKHTMHATPFSFFFDGAKEARLTAICCSKAPDGRRRWTLRMLADRLVELNILDSISHETVRRTLQKTN